MTTTIKTRQMTIWGTTTHEGFVILQNGEKIFSGLNRKTKRQAIEDAKNIMLGL